MKRFACTFVLAGSLSVVGQLLLLAWSGVLGADSALVGPCALSCFGLVGLGVALAGVVPRMMQETVMGVIMPTAGIVMGVASTVVEAARSGCGVRGALMSGARIPLLVLGGGTVLTMGLRIVVGMVSGTSLALAFPPVEVPVAVQVIGSFAVGGAIACVAEGLLVLTKMDPPVLMLWIMLFGSVMAAFNLDAAPIFANAGFSASILSAGQGVYDAFGLLLEGGGIEMFGLVIAVFVWVSVLGLAGGLLRLRIEERRRGMR